MANQSEFTCAGAYRSKFEQTREVDQAYASYQYSKPQKAYEIYQEVGRTGYARALYYVGLLNAHAGCPECVGWLQACVDKQHRLWSVLAENLLGEWYFDYATPRQPEKALSLFTSSAQRGSMMGKYWLGCWQMRQGDKTEGIMLLRQAAEAQLKSAQLELGWLTFHEDKQAGLRLYEQGVKNPGEAPDQYNLGKTRLDEPLTWFRLGYMHQRTGSMPEACWWFTLATKKRQRDAQWALGKAYLFGHGGLTRDKVVAMQLIQLAVKQNQKDAQHGLAHILLHGSFGFQQDKVEGLRLLQEAVSQNHLEAQYDLARVKLFGDFGLSPDTTEGLKLLQGAVSQNHRLAQYGLGRAKLLGQFGLSPDITEGIGLIQLAAEQGLRKAQTQMGLAFLEGAVEGVAGFIINWTKGIRWLQLAVNQNDPEGLFYLGRAYLLGWYGLPKNPKEGARLLQLAAQKENNQAIQLLSSPTN